MYQPSRVGGAGRYRSDATRIFTTASNCNNVDGALSGHPALNSFSPSKEFGDEDQLVLRNAANLQVAGNNAAGMGIVLKAPPDQQKYLLEIDMTAGMITQETELLLIPIMALLLQAQKINTLALGGSKTNTGTRPQLLPVTANAKHGNNHIMHVHHTLIYSDEGATRADAHGIWIGWWLANVTGQGKTWLNGQMSLDVTAKFDTYHESVFEPQ